MFEYLYTEGYLEEATSAIDAQGLYDSLKILFQLLILCLDDDKLAKHVCVYTLGDYFGIEGLKDAASKILKAKSKELWACESFIDCIRAVYEAIIDSQDPIREACANTAHVNLRLWTKNPFQELVREGGEFALNLMSKSASTLSR